jgi:isopenicillin N synthase-like dioxygenase
MKILKVSFSDLKSNEGKVELIKSFKKTGFAIITDYPLDFTDIYDSWKEYFQLPLKDKLKKKFDPNALSQSGYFPYKTENAKDQKLPDLKEFYHIFKLTDVPEQIDKNEVRNILTNLKLLGTNLLDIVSDEMGFGKDLSNSTVNGNTLLRVIYYPEIGSEEGIRAAAHEDINLITLLPASTATGLEVKDAQGNWHSVGTNKNDIVVNIGDMLEMYSEGTYKSTTHRVVNMPGDRLSMPLFIHPRPEFHLGRMTAKEYLNQRLTEIGLKGE